jgi:hypothetical protein
VLRVRPTPSRSRACFSNSSPNTRVRGATEHMWLPCQIYNVFLFIFHPSVPPAPFWEHGRKVSGKDDSPVRVCLCPRGVSPQFEVHAFCLPLCFLHELLGASATPSCPPPASRAWRRFSLPGLKGEPERATLGHSSYAAPLTLTTTHHSSPSTHPPLSSPSRWSAGGPRLAVARPKSLPTPRARAVERYGGSQGERWARA